MNLPLMLQHVEVMSTRANHGIDPHMHIWGWEIPVYLFLGGLAAGLIILGALASLRNRTEQDATQANLAPLFVLPVLAIGMTALFLDLSYKVHVFRFYTAFKVTSPMSWGSWILLFVGAGAVFSAAAALLRHPYTRETALAKMGLVKWAATFAEKHRAVLARFNIGFGLALGIYTGVLLSGFSARPFWNSGILGPLFLVSGASTAAALLALLTNNHGEHERLIRLDLALVGTELTLLGLWIIGLLTHGAPTKEAASLILGGAYTAPFWGLVVIAGLLVPATLEIQALRKRWAETPVAPVLVLLGGLALRFVMVSAGQSVGF